MQRALDAHDAARVAAAEIAKVKEAKERLERATITEQFMDPTLLLSVFLGCAVAGVASYLLYLSLIPAKKPAVATHAHRAPAESSDAVERSMSAHQRKIYEKAVESQAIDESVLRDSPLAPTGAEADAAVAKWNDEAKQDAMMLAVKHGDR